MGKKIDISKIDSLERLKEYDDDVKLVWDESEKPLKLPSGYTQKSLLPSDDGI